MNIVYIYIHSFSLISFICRLWYEDWQLWVSLSFYPQQLSSLFHKYLIAPIHIHSSSIFLLDNPFFIFLLSLLTMRLFNYLIIRRHISGIFKSFPILDSWLRGAGRCTYRYYFTYDAEAYLAIKRCRKIATNISNHQEPAARGFEPWPCGFNSSTLSIRPPLPRLYHYGIQVPLCYKMCIYLAEKMRPIGTGIL